MKELNSGALRFQFLGYPIKISIWFCISVCVLLLVDRGGTFGWCMLAAGMHELGHLWMLAAVGYPKCEIWLTAFGIRLIRRDGAGNDWRKDFLVNIAGPLMNVLVCSIILGIGRCLNGWETIRLPAETQLALGAFNLLPVYPLDGGQAVAALLNGILPLHIANLIGNVLTLLFLLPLFVLGILVLFRSQYNWTLLFFALYLTAFFLLKDYY